MHTTFEIFSTIFQLEFNFQFSIFYNWYGMYKKVAIIINALMLDSGLFSVGTKTIPIERYRIPIFHFRTQTGIQAPNYQKNSLKIKYLVHISLV